LDKSYDDQVREQIEQYRDTKTMHDLPPAFHLWSGAHVAPGLREVFGVDDVAQFYAEAFTAAAAGAPGAPRFLSLGCGDGGVEIGVARALIDRGITEFTFVCCDLSEILLGRFRAAIPEAMGPLFHLVAGDLNSTTFDALFDGIMANHSLHHILDLEGVYATAWSTLADHGVFATADMIGRNGHLRWPEARAFVQFLWPFLTRRQRGNVLLRRQEDRFIDHDCSGEGFEGIRAQEVLPLLLAQGFQPWKFFGFGGIVDVFVDRCFGPHFDVNDPDDAFLIRRIGWLNDVLLDTGALKPTMMFAWFTKQPGETTHYRRRTAMAAVRSSEADPPWLAGALADFALHPDDPAYEFRAPAPPVDPAASEAQRAALHQAQADAATARDHLRALEKSTSWRITAPVRTLARLLRG
jgi:SAM-dependent methyltransferase